MALTESATLADLARVRGKAELVGGRIVPLMPAEFWSGRIGGRIYRSLDDHAAATGAGIALPDNVGFAVPTLSSGRESFSPDAACYAGPLPADRMRFVPGPPTLAVEVRSEGDCGPAEEDELAATRADYFEAGTFVVWDVDPVAECVRVYRREAPDAPAVFRRGEEADAEPAVPGWKLAVDAIFR